MIVIEQLLSRFSVQIEKKMKKTEFFLENYFLAFLAVKQEVKCRFWKVVRKKRKKNQTFFQKALAVV